MSKVKIAVAHAAWAEGRKRGLSRVLEVCPDAKVFTSTRREHSFTWAGRVWEWIASQDSPVCVLNDDVKPHPKLPAILDAIVEAVGERVVAMHPNNVHFAAAREHGAHWARCYLLTGPAYMLTPTAAKEMVELMDQEPRLFSANGVNEDTVGSCWAWNQQEPIWTTIPALVDHDVAIPSTLGYDKHPNRTSLVPWSQCDEDLTNPDYWRKTDVNPYVPNVWLPWQRLTQIRYAMRLKQTFCSMCLAEAGIVGSNNMKIGPKCIENSLRALGYQVADTAPPPTAKSL